MSMDLGQSQLETARCLRLLGTAENEMARGTEHKQQIHEQMAENRYRNSRALETESHMFSGLSLLSAIPQKHGDVRRTLVLIFRACVRECGQLPIWRSALGGRVGKAGQGMGVQVR